LSRASSEASVALPSEKSNGVSESVPEEQPQQQEAKTEEPAAASADPLPEKPTSPAEEAEKQEPYEPQQTEKTENEEAAAPESNKIEETKEPTEEKQEEPKTEESANVELKEEVTSDSMLRVKLILIKEPQAPLPIENEAAAPSSDNESEIKIHLTPVESPTKEDEQVRNVSSE